MSPPRAPTIAGSFVAGLALELALRPGGRQVLLWADDGGTFLAALVAALACAAAARRAGSDRRAWALLAAGVGSWSGGELVWAVYELGPRGSVPFPSLADVGYLLAVPLVAAGVLAFRISGRPLHRARSLLDGMIVAGSVLLVSWVAVLGAVFRSGTGDALRQAISLAYPAGDVVICTMVVIALARASRYRGNPLVPVGLGLLAMAVSDSTYTWLVANNRYSTGDPVDLGWVAAYVLLAVAAFGARGVADLQPGDAADEGVTPVSAILIPYSLLSVAFVTTLVTAIAGPRRDPFVLVTGAALVALVVARQLVTLLDNRRLAASLYLKVAELGAREQQLQHLAFHDELTGLANRTLFLERVRAAVAARAVHPAPLAVLFIDLDDFKTINDSLGHGAGDQLLVAAAGCIERCLGSGDTAARLGGDEFGVLIAAPGLPGDPNPGPVAVASRLLDAFRQSVRVAGRDLVARASIGIAHSAAGREPAEELLRQADTAMYAAKQRGKCSWEVFDARMAAEAEERLVLHVALTASLESDSLDLHYQPVVDLATGDVWAYEALARWWLPGRGPVPPAVFIPLAEERGLIHELGRWSLVRACEEAAQWQSDAMVSVNVSAIQLADASIVGTVIEALATSGLPARRLLLEITESVLMRNADVVPARLRALRELGVKIGIDDFGTGYSSLSYLPRFPVDVIKIDQSLVQSAEESRTGAAVVRAIVELAATLGVATVAEGIEHERQALALRAIGCHRGQGYWLGAPQRLVTRSVREPAG